MTAIAAYLKKNGKYPLNYTTTKGGSMTDIEKLLLLSNTGGTWWESMTYDSASSPAILEKFGKKIGYPVRSMFDDYTRGTANWEKYHFYAIHESDGKMYECCPLATTNQIYLPDKSKLPKFDFSKL